MWERVKVGAREVLEVDVGEEGHLDNLPDQTEYQVRPPLLDVTRADVDHLVRVRVRLGLGLGCGG